MMKKECVPMIVLGGGGHTQEMLEIVRKGPVFPRINLVHSACDFISKDRFIKEIPYKSYSVYTVPRPNNVREAYSVVKILHSLLVSLVVAFKSKSDFLICNGPGICVPIILAYKLFHPFKPVFYIESVTRVHSLSTTEKIVQYIARVFIVQSKYLEHKTYPYRTYHSIFNINTKLDKKK